MAQSDDAEATKKCEVNVVEESSVSSIENEAKMSEASPISAPSVISNADSNSADVPAQESNKASEPNKKV